MWGVIVLFVLCMLVVISGIVVGVWCWCFCGYYCFGVKMLYVELWMCWYYLIGLCVVVFVFIWIFSGLMLMNLLGVFSSMCEVIDSGCYWGGVVVVDGVLGDFDEFLVVVEVMCF